MIIKKHYLTMLPVLGLIYGCKQPAPTSDQVPSCIDDTSVERPEGYNRYTRVAMATGDNAISTFRAAGWDVTVLNGAGGINDSYFYLHMICENPITPPDPPDPPEPEPDDRVLLSQKNFNTRSYWNIQTGDSAYQRGLDAHIRADGRLAFYTLEYQGAAGGSVFKLIEYTTDGVPEGQTVFSPQVLNTYDLAPYFWAGADNHYSIRTDDEAGLVWFQMAADYPGSGDESDEYNTWSFKLADGNKVVEAKGPYGLLGIQERTAVGGVIRIPESFRRRFGKVAQTAGSLLSVGGEYASRMSYGVSLGLTTFSHADYQTLGNTGKLPAYKVLSDHRSGTTNADWYASGAPTFLDRGQRLSPVNNAFDYDASTNTYYWTSPAPDKVGRWPWGDAYYGTINWIDWKDVYGLVGVLTAGIGDVYYAVSQLVLGGRAFEFHVFDPTDLGKTLTGAHKAWNVQPKSMWVEPKFAEGINGPSNAGMMWSIHAMDCLEVKRQCYALATGVTAGSSRVYIIDVNSNK